MSIYGALLRTLMRASVRKLKANWNECISDPHAAQLERMRTILCANAETVYGRENSFSSINDEREFAQNVPIVKYADLSSYIDRMKCGEENVLVSSPVEMFATTSGTTGEPKFLPITRPMNLEQHISHRIWMAQLTADHPKVTEGFFHTSFSPAEEGRTVGGIPFGSMSGKNYRNQPIPVRRKHAVPYDVCEIKDYSARHYATLAFMLARNLSIVTSVNPSTLCVLAERLAVFGSAIVEDLENKAKTGAGGLRNCPNLSDAECEILEPLLKVDKNRVRFLREVLQDENVLHPASVWPELEIINTWHGGNAPFYLSRLPQYWGGVATRCLGLRASEGMFSIPLSDRTAEGALAVWGHFMEFFPEDVDPANETQSLLAHELEKGRRYRMVITTSGGLYRYDLGDVVEVTGFLDKTPTVAFLHKAGHVLSITGEKVTEEQIVSAMRRIAKDFPISGFSVTLNLDGTPRYLLAYEEIPGAGLSDDKVKELLAGFDSELSALNIEYKEKRASSRLDLPVGLRLESGTYEKYRQRLVEQGRPEGQIKPPHFFKSEADLKARLVNLSV